MNKFPENDNLILFDKYNIIIENCIKEILKHTRWLEKYLSDLMGEILMNSTHGKRFFCKEAVINELGISEDDYDCKAKDSPFLIWKEHDLNFLELSAGFIFSSVYSNRQTVYDEFKKLNLYRSTKEEMIRKLYDILLKYQEKTIKLNKIISEDSLTLNKINLEFDLINNELKYIESIIDPVGSLFHLTSFLRRSLSTVDTIRSEIAQPFLRLVLKHAVKIAASKSNLNQNEQSKIYNSFQNGLIGLMQAISYFEPSEGRSFGVYAKFWVRQAILYLIKKRSNFISLPPTIWQMYKKLKFQHDKLQKEGSLDEDEFLKTTGVNIEKYREIETQISMIHPKSLSDPIENNGEDENVTLFSMLEDENVEVYEEFEEDPQRMTFGLLNGLTEEEKKIINLRYGLCGKNPVNEKSPEVFIQKILKIITS